MKQFKRHFLDESESILFKPFFIKFNFDFGVLAQKCLKPCVNGALKFQFFFLNLSSKVLASVIVRTSKYTYMDIRVLGGYKQQNMVRTISVRQVQLTVI